MYLWLHIFYVISVPKDWYVRNVRTRLLVTSYRKTLENWGRKRAIDTWKWERLLCSLRDHVGKLSQVSKMQCRDASKLKSKPLQHIVLQEERRNSSVARVITLLSNEITLLARLLMIPSPLGCFERMLKGIWIFVTLDASEPIFHGNESAIGRRNRFPDPLSNRVLTWKRRYCS